MKYNVSLDSRELNKLAGELLNYADSFEYKVRVFLEKLANLGFEVASVNGGDFSRYIVYSKHFDNGTTIKLTASSSPLVSEWYAGSKGGTTRAEIISPVLMAEFGSGHYAISGEGEAAGLGGQGTLNVYGHAFDTDGWYWWSDDAAYRSEDEYLVKTANGRYKFHSRGVHPAQPLHKAVMACIEQVERIAREVFG